MWFWEYQVRKVQLFPAEIKRIRQHMKAMKEKAAGESAGRAEGGPVEGLRE